MGFLRIAAAVGVVGLAVSWAWRRFQGETVDLHDVDARRQAAARWVGDGEIEEAERMLHEAVDSLKGWPQAVAMGDLGTLLAACHELDEATDWLAKACEGPAVSEDERLERVELRIRWSHILMQLDEMDAAEQAMAAEPGIDSYDDLPGVLASEALAELLIEQGRYQEALDRLQLTLPLLRTLKHDRAASCQVSIAYVATHESKAQPWQDLETLDEDLQRAVLVNLADRSVNWEPAVWAPCIDTLLEVLPESEDWDSAREQLRELQHCLADALR